MKKKRNQKNNTNIITVLVSAIAAVLVFITFTVLVPVEKKPFTEGDIPKETSAITEENKTEEINNIETTSVTTTRAPVSVTVKNNEETGRIVVNPEQEQWNLAVVNMGREMPRDYKPVLDEILSTGYYMDERVAPFYEKMYNAAKKDGIILTPYSGYRSYERQERNYKNLTEQYMSQYNLSRKEAAKKAATVILPPGTSEHNLGLAMDICNTKNSFADTKEYKWLTENAHKYGFILRYTSDKMDITGIVDEPWHWRYVGVEYAEDIKNSGLCLEEYLDKKGIAY